MKVLIVGAGPVGLTLAHLLSKIGVSSLILEKESHFSKHPKAHVISSRSMEIFNSIGIAEEMYRKSPPLYTWGSFIYTNDLTSKPYRTIDHTLSENYKRNCLLSKFHGANLSQHKLVDILSDRLPSNSNILFNKDVKSVIEGDKVKVITKDNEEFEADYAIGCDGARSDVRRILNITKSVSPFEDNVLSFHFFSKELAELALKNPGNIYFCYSKNVICALIMHNADEGEFILHNLQFPPLQKIEDFNIYDLVNSTAGKKINDVQFKDVKVWKMTSSYNHSFGSKKVFLAGDSAHTTTPAGGFGLNLGIKDVNNLFWKFNYPELLNTYGQERIPHCKEISEKSTSYSNRFLENLNKVGLDPKMVHSLKNVLQWVPGGKFLFNSVLYVGQKYLADFSKLTEILKNDENIIPHFFPDEDLLFKYNEGFVTPQGGMLAPLNEVEYKGRKVNLRELSEIVVDESKSPVFLRVNGKGKLPNFNYPVVDVQSNGDESFIIRPDSIVYARSKKDE